MKKFTIIAIFCWAVIYYAPVVASPLTSQSKFAFESNLLDSRERWGDMTELAGHLFILSGKTLLKFDPITWRWQVIVDSNQYPGVIIQAFDAGEKELYLAGHNTSGQFRLWKLAPPHWQLSELPIIKIPDIIESKKYRYFRAFISTQEKLWFTMSNRRGEKYFMYDLAHRTMTQIFLSEKTILPPSLDIMVAKRDIMVAKRGVSIAERLRDKLQGSGCSGPFFWREKWWDVDQSGGLAIKEGDTLQHIPPPKEGIRRWGNVSLFF